MRDPKLDPAVGDELEDVFHRIVVRKIQGAGATIRVDLWQTTRDRVLGTSMSKAIDDLTSDQYAALVRRMRVKFAAAT